ncbi:MAG: Ig-like domain-containing protein, partial [Candidatus Woesearchaeota archaeon]|nr:Ig-like domain-containing protein [Candidatus Woesearchaeota archaeon]
DPIAYSFTAPLDDEGKWKTQVGDAAEYKVKIIASDGENTVEQDVILVVLPKNKAPSITIEDSFTIEEGETLTLTPKVGDPEGGEVSVSYSGWMTSAERSTDFDDAGEFSVTITASDGVMKSSKTVSVTVKNVNRAPTIDRLENLEIIAGEEVKVEPSASDPDGDDLTFTFSAPLSPEGVWQTSEGETGSYKVKVLVTDGVEQDSTDLTISVRPKNLPPELSLSGSITVSEGDAIVIEATATDPEGEEVVITYSGWMRTNTYQTDFDDAGTHKVVVTASDGVNSVSEDISITVEDLNRPPSFDPGAFN